MLTTGMRHHRQGQLPEAERIYRRILSIDSLHAGGLHMLGTLAHQVGRQDVAIQLIRAAISIDPGHAAYYSNLATVLQAQSLLQEAAAAYQDALDPLRGRLALAQGPPGQPLVPHRAPLPPARTRPLAVRAPRRPWRSQGLIQQTFLILPRPWLKQLLRMHHLKGMAMPEPAKVDIASGEFELRKIILQRMVP